MPFTASHVAAILPLRRAKLDVPALVIGAMSPDVSYVVELYGPQVEAHSLQGLIVFCLPVSLVLYAAWRAYAARVWIALCPWMADENRGSCGNVVLSVLIGAVTHVVWDGFTHRTGFAVEALAPWLDAPVYRVLQHASTLFGAACVVVAVRSTMRRRKAPFATKPRVFGWLGASVALVTVALSLLAQPVATTFVRITFAGIGAVALVVLGYPLRAALQRSNDKTRT